MAGNNKKQMQTEDLNRLYPAKVCDLLSITRRTLKNWMELETDPIPYFKNDEDKQNPYLFEWPRVLAWVVRREVNKDLRRLGDAPADKAEAEDRDKAASAMIKELKLLKMRDQLVEVTAVEELWTEKILTARTLLLTVGHKVAARILPNTSTEQIKALISNEIEIALRVLADSSLATSRPAEDEEEEEDDEGGSE